MTSPASTPTPTPAPIPEKSEPFVTAGLLVGLILIAGGFFFLYLEMHEGIKEAHTNHIYVFAGMIGLGCLAIAPKILVSAIRGVVDAVSPIVPKINFGRRKGDTTESPTKEPDA